MEWEIRYYLDEGGYKSGIPAYTETVYGDRQFVISWAQNVIDNSGSEFKYFDVIQKG